MKLAQLIAQTGEHEATIQVLCHLLEAERTNVFLIKDISESVAKEAIKIIDQYKKGTPLAYLLGSTYFYNRKFIVTPAVLVPRHDTEVLVELAEKKIIADSLLGSENPTYQILDLCCGSGIIGISLAYLCDWLHHNNRELRYEITAVDYSPEALAVAAQNASLHHADINLVYSDLLEDVHGKFDLLVCNPPYVRTADIGVEDKWVLKEPHMALDGGIDGLYFYRRILATAKKHLTTHGMIMFEIGYDQAAAVEQIALEHGYSMVKVYKDLANRNRVVTIRV
ncbi:MAG: peptide chain release factor N(5)-glutamine methyltransferase [Eubacteriales bacterium]|nr:peptide chain release factor N(5)-glutamine methyltransferase [Eubacteriales bacterium]